MIICSSNNIDFIQGVIAYGNEPLITDWRIENSNGVLNVLNSKSNNANLAVLESGNISIGNSIQSGSLAIYGDVNITGNYNKNSRDVINDTSNYVLSTSNILVSRIRTEVNYTSNYVSTISLGSGGGSSQWTSGTSLIFYNGGNVGIGTATPSSKLHIYNDNNNTSNLGLLIQNNLSISATPNITIVGTTLTTIGVDKIITFPYSGSGATMSYSFTTTEVLQCDILIVGGGGGGGYSYAGGGGGGGGYVYLQNINFPIGTYNVNVGRGGAAGVNGAAPAGWGINGNNSSITGGINYTALGGGGGAGGSAFANITATGSNGGSGGGGSYSGGTPVVRAGGTSTQVSTYGYGNGGNGNSYASPFQSGGGGGGASGNTTAGSGTGNNGLANSITGSSITYAGGGGAGSDLTTASQGGSGGGGAGANSSGTLNAIAGTDGLGGGGGGARGGGVGPAARGGSGIVIIRYRSSVTNSSSINFMIGTSINTIRNYNIGNYNGEYKINTSKQGTSDATFFRIADDGTMYNAQGTTNFTSASDKRVKENIEEASYNKCYENINSLELYRFNYINNFNTINNDNKQLGFIAQEVREYFPKAVYSNNYNNNNINIGDLLSIDVSQINYTLYGAVKKLIEMNEDKEIRIKRLEYLLNIDTSNITLDTSNIALDNTEQYINRYWQYINQYTSNIAIDTSNIAIDTSNIAIDTSNIAIDTSNIAIDTSNISIYTSNIAIDTSNIAIDI